MGLLPIPAPKLTQGASRAGFWRVRKGSFSIAGAIDSCDC